MSQETQSHTDREQQVGFVAGKVRDSVLDEERPRNGTWDGVERRAAVDEGMIDESADGCEADTERRSGLDRRRGPGRRRTDYRRAAEEGEMNEEQLAFILAVDEYKRSNNKPHPTLTEILDVLLYLGYRKVAEPGEFMLTKPRQTPDRRRGGAGKAGAEAAREN